MSGCSSCSGSTSASAYIQQAIQAKTDPEEILRARQEARLKGTDEGASANGGATVNTQGQAIGTLVNATA